MKPTRRMWISAGIVGVVLAGGVSIAAVASAGRIDRAEIERAGEVSQEDLPFSQASPTYSPGRAPGEVPGGEVPKQAEPTQDPEDFIVSHKINPTDPGDAADYWTGERMESAEPLPMPVITVTPGG